MNVFSFTSWQTVGCATPGNPSHIPSQPAIGQKVLVLSTATSATEQMTNGHELDFPSELNITPPSPPQLNHLMAVKDNLETGYMKILYLVQTTSESIITDFWD